MKIKKIECVLTDLKLTEPYTIAYETVDSFQNIFLRLETAEGIVGWGCAAPDLTVTGETATDVLNTFREVIEPILKGADPFRYAFLLESIKEASPKAASARAMVDMALFDLMAKQAQVPLYQLLGGYRKSISTSITIGIMPIFDTVQTAMDYVEKEFHALKLKGGLNVEKDIEKIMRVRKAVGPKVLIRFDANQGYSVEEAIHFVKATQSAKVEIIEQPTLQNNDVFLSQVTQHTHIPVMADESLKTLNDAYRITKNDLADMVNIKLMKVGGILDGQHINSIAKAGKLECMVGCLDESALGISAGLHFALSRPNIHYADLDGHLDIVKDPFAGMVHLKKGKVYPNAIPGLGWEKAPVF